ncbi:HIT domain-containing protein [Acidobacteriota bacterium]
MIKYITAPWREEYVKKAFKMTECIFCRALQAETDKEAFILHRAKHNFLILNRYPYTPGHLMIAPYAHLDSIEKAEKEITDEMADLLKLSLRVLRKTYRPHGFNTGMNIGHSAGAGVADHYHLHLIPRWTGDANFMPLIGNTKVVIEDIETTYKKLKSQF